MTDLFQLDRYVIVDNGGIQTVHRNPKDECRLDVSSHDRSVNAFEAESLMLQGSAIPCRHCIGDKWG